MSIVNTIRTKSNTILSYVKLNPLKALVVTLLLLLIVIYIGDSLRSSAISDIEIETTSKPVDIFYIGESPKIKVLATVEKAEVIDIYAQTGGVIDRVYVSAGKDYKYGTNILRISTNYLGANAVTIQKSIAEKQYKNYRDTYEDSKQLINEQIDLANKQDKNLDELRELSRKVEGETRDQVKLNESILSSLESNLETLEETNVGGSNDSDILLTRQAISTYTTALNANKQAQRNLALNNDSTGTANSIASLQKDTVVKQLELQKKSLDLSLELSELQYKLSLINESLFYPSLPYEASIQEVHVKRGDLVSPGTKLVTISGSGNTTVLKAYLPKEIISKLSLSQDATITLGKEIITVVPIHVSSEPTQGQLYYVIFQVPEDKSNLLANQENIILTVSVGVVESSGSFISIPIDAVHQSPVQEVVYVDLDGRAQSRVVTLGNVIGDYVEIIDGLQGNERIILDRNVFDGDLVTER